MDSNHLSQEQIKVKLIFNPIAGAGKDSPEQLLDIVRELQNLAFIPELFLVEENSDLDGVVERALAQGIQRFLVCGGDGTIDTVAAKLVGTTASLGIYPKGTQNNIALSLGIPDDLHSALETFHSGQTLAIDVGRATFQGQEHIFLETCSIGLLSALFPAADQIQHGDLTRIGDLLATLVDSTASQIRLILDNGQELNTSGHVVLAANMPFVGPHFRLAQDESYLDGLLDLIVFSNLTKIELISGVLQMAGGQQKDERIHRYRVKQVEIETEPKMPILADGFHIGEGGVKIVVQSKALKVFVPQPTEIKPE